MKEIHLKVEGMVCEGCENRIKNVLQDMEGIKKVDANHSTCEVNISLNKEVEKEEIEKKIQDLGFVVVEE